MPLNTRSPVSGPQGGISDRTTVYQRYIDNTGTLMRDSLVGVQLDVKLNDQWGAAARCWLPRKRIAVQVRLCWVFCWLCCDQGARAGVTVIGHESWATVDGFDKTLVSRIFTGRTVQFAGISIQPVNMKTGDAVRAVFIKEIFMQTDDEYVACWIVRRAIGKGVPPAEMNSAQEMIEFVRSNPGAVGYIDASYVPPGIKTLLTLP